MVIRHTTYPTSAMFFTLPTALSWDNSWEPINILRLCDDIMRIGFVRGNPETLIHDIVAESQNILECFDELSPITTIFSNGYQA